MPPTLHDTELVFAALAHQARRSIVLLLSQSGGELPSGYLAARFQHSWPTTTRHLNVLQDAGVIDVRREGRSCHYRLNRQRIDFVVGQWLLLLTPVDPQRTWESSGPKTTRELKARATPRPRLKKKVTRRPHSEGARP